MPRQRFQVLGSIPADDARLLRQGYIESRQARFERFDQPARLRRHAARRWEFCPGVRAAGENGLREAGSIGRVDDARQDRRMNRIGKPVFPVAAPIYEVARPPARLALDTFVEVDDDLRLSLRTDVSLEDVSGADVPESRRPHGVPLNQRQRPQDVNVRLSPSLIGQAREPIVPVPRGLCGKRREVPHL